MGDIIVFSLVKRPARPSRTLHKAAQILFFTGVRREILPEAAAVASSGADTAAPSDKRRV